MDGRGGPQEREMDADEQVVGLEEKHVHPVQSLLLTSYLCENIDSSALYYYHSFLAGNVFTCSCYTGMGRFTSSLSGWVFSIFSSGASFYLPALGCPLRSHPCCCFATSQHSLCTVISMLLASPATCQLVSLPESPLLRSFLFTKPFYALMHRCKIDTFQEFWSGPFLDQKPLMTKSQPTLPTLLPITWRFRLTHSSVQGSLFLTPLWLSASLI